MTWLRFLFLFLMTSFSLMALDPNKIITQYNVQVWNMQEGLPGNSVLALRQTQDGYLWIGTLDGLGRFDGVHFELFTKGKIPQLKDNVIRALYQDQNGILWIGTSSGGLTRYTEGEFMTYPITEHKALYKISAISEDRWGNLWIGSITEGLTCLHLSSGNFTTYTTKQRLPHNQVRFIHKDGNADLWVATAAGIVKLLKPGNFQIYAPQDFLPFFKTTCLYEEETDTLWIGTGGGALFRIKNGTLSSYGTEAGIPHLTITYLFQDRMKNLWIGTDGGGLTRMKDGVFSTIPGEDRLTDGFVYSIYEDREGSLWIGTLEGGLHQLRDSKFTTFTTREGLIHDYVDCIYESRDGDLWIGTIGGLSLLKLKKGIMTTVLTTREGLLNNIVLSLFEDPSGYLWIGTWDGLYRFKDGKLFTLTKRDGLSDNRIACIVGDAWGNTWIGTWNGLNRYNASNGQFTLFTTNEGLLSNLIVFIFEDSKGNLWVGTDAGLNCLRDGVITAYKQESGIEKNFFRCGYEDKPGTLWFGTKGGLIRMTVKEKEAALHTHTYTFTVQSGLIENDVYSIVEDERGYLWLAGRKGISRVRKKELENFAAGKIDRVQPDRYNEKDGMKSRWCTGTGCKTRDGRFWFPTSKGVTMIDPNHIKKNILPPSLIIEKLIVDGESINIHAKAWKKKPVELAPGKKRVEIYYTAVSFINSREIKFKSMLKGYDSDWVNMGNARSTNYTSLSPGHYTFKMMACNADGVWNEKEASFSFYLKPYFYQTSWFYLLVVLFVLLVTFSLYRFRVRQLKTREKELSALVELRTGDLKERNIELENAQQKLRHSKDLIEAKSLQLEKQSEKLKEMDQMKSRFFANISHEFRTPLTLIMGPLEQRLSNCRDKEQERELEMMLRNSRRLLTLINQLLDLSRFDSGKMNLQAVRQDIVPFLRGIVNSLDSLALQNELTLTFQTREEEILLYYDAGKIEEAVLNLLFNAVKFTPPGGRISVTLGVTGEPFPGFLEISVCDTGVGIPVEQLDHIFDRFHQAQGLAGHNHRGSGIGLALAKEVVKLHHGEITVHSEVGNGSEFVIRLPLGHEHLKPEEIAREPVETENRKFLRGAGAVFSKSAPNRESAPWTGRRQEEDELAETAVPTRKAEKNIILLVEDNDDVREYIRGPLQPLYQVVEAVDGEEGIKKAQKIIPDLVISDIMMPGIDGYQLCRELKTDINTSHIPVILLTAKASEESMVTGLEIGADDYITKPFSIKILLARIKNLIDLRRQLQENMRRQMTLQPAKVSLSPVDDDFIKELQEAIEQNLSDTRLNVKKLCKILTMSHSNLYRKVQALTGESPGEYIRSYRLKRAAEMLQADFGSVADVAFEVGFSSTAYFTSCFKERFRKLPSTYRASRDRSS